jgi:hypothetical protein
LFVCFVLFLLLTFSCERVLFVFCGLCFFVCFVCALCFNPIVQVFFCVVVFTVVVSLFVCFLAFAHF